ncbi:MAG: hypothetical protein WAM82_14940 [Thermoanaerobaculia bacterium]
MPNPTQALANELEREAVSTRRLLERVPADRLDWQPHPKAMTLGQLAFHLANIPGNISRLASLDGFDASTANFNPAPPQARTPYYQPWRARWPTRGLSSAASTRRPRPLPGV